MRHATVVAYNSEQIVGTVIDWDESAHLRRGGLLSHWLAWSFASISRSRPPTGLRYSRYDPPGWRNRSVPFHQETKPDIR